MYIRCTCGVSCAHMPPTLRHKASAEAGFGMCPVQVQHVYTVLQKSGGGTRRAAMAELRQEYERSLKFSGKV